MPREKFEFVQRLGLYRKRIKDTDGKYVAIYGKTPTELSEKLKSARRTVESGQASKVRPQSREARSPVLQALMSAISPAISMVAGLLLCSVLFRNVTV